MEKSYLHENVISRRNNAIDVEHEGQVNLDASRDHGTTLL